LSVNSFPQRAKAKPGRPSGGAKKEELVQLARHGASIAHESLKRNHCGFYAALRMFFWPSRIRLSSVIIGCQKRHIQLGTTIL
jgi:hypothetical protein